MDPQEFNEASAARILGVSAKTLAKWRREGRVAHLRWPGGRISYTASALAAFRASCHVPARDGAS